MYFKDIFYFSNQVLAHDALTSQQLQETQLLFMNDLASLESYAKHENIKVEKNHVLLRSKKGYGSVLNIKEDIKTDNWSIEFQVKNMVLHDIEKAGFYIWYTDKDVRSGSYLGGDTTFNGFVTGIEFSKDRADLIFSHNFGNNFKGKEMHTIRYDHINPALIDHLDFLNIKVIHTENNFKIEIYDQELNLISDSFRIIEPLVMHKELKRKHFSITTKYEHCKNDVFFELSNIKINSRIENETYDHNQINTEHNQYPRNKGDHELRVAIADISHFMNYLVLVLGNKGNNNILDMTMEAKKKMRILQSSIDKLIEESKKNNSLTNDKQEANMKSKIEDLETSLSNNLLRIENLKEKLNTKQKKNKLDLKGILLCGSLAGLVVIICLQAKDVYWEFVAKSGINKKE